LFHNLIDPYFVSTGRILIKAKGSVWHKFSMIDGVVPRSGIDTDARWKDSVIQMIDYLDTNYIEYLASTGSFIVVPLAADFTTANIPNNKMYSNMQSTCYNQKGNILYVCRS
jgi:hypothetical protein